MARPEASQWAGSPKLSQVRSGILHLIGPVFLSFHHHQHLIFTTSPLEQTTLEPTTFFRAALYSLLLHPPIFIEHSYSQSCTAKQSSSRLLRQPFRPSHKVLPAAMAAHLEACLEAVHPATWLTALPPISLKVLPKATGATKQSPGTRPSRLTAPTTQPSPAPLHQSGRLPSL